MQSHREIKKKEVVYITTATKLRMRVESNVPEQETILLCVQRSLKIFELNAQAFTKQ